MTYSNLTYEQLNEDLERIGLSPLSAHQLELAHRVLSVALGKGRGYRHHVNATNHVVARMCSVSFEDDVTLEEHPVLLPAVPMVAAGNGEVLRGWPRGRETITRLKLDVRALDELWRQATTKASGSRCFRSDWTTGFWCTAASTTPTDEPARSSDGALRPPLASTYLMTIEPEHGAASVLTSPALLSPQGSRTNDRRLSAPPEAVTQTALIRRARGGGRH